MWTFTTTQSVNQQQAKLTKLQQQLAHYEAENEQLHRACAELEQQNQTLLAQKQFQQQVSSSLEQFEQSMRHLESSMELLSQRLSKQQEQSGDMSELAEQSASQMASSLTQLEQLEGQSKQALLSLNELTQEAKDIFSVVELIRSISDQTNLLSLNAAIEAARAGEHGRGFSVVADEVRKLAQETTQSTEVISQSVNQIIQQVQVVGAQFEKMSSETQQLSANFSNSVTTSHQVGKHCKDSEQASARAAAVFEVELANLQELRLKMMVYRTILGGANYQPNEIPDHHQCRLGSWYDNLNGQNSLNQHPVYKQIQQPHQEVHLSAKQALKSFHEDDMMTSINALEKMEKANWTVVQLMQQLLAEVEKNIQQVLMAKKIRR